ncbi:MAG: flagellar export protein FliJ [Desulfobacterales bacterium]|nr:flagellar export protein FliJ [Desulfobacterales bacterium]
MKKFQFRLQSLLRYREFLEREAKQQLLQAQSEVIACDERIKKYSEAYESWALKLENRTGEGINFYQYQLYTNYLESMDTMIKQETQLRAKLQEKVHKAQQLVLQKQKDKKILENFKERKKELYYQEVMALEQKETDETIILRKVKEFA